MRSAISDFSLANPIYAGATVTFYTVSGGVKTATKSTLYSAKTGTATLSNPQYLDYTGKLVQPVYLADDTIASVTGLTIADHDTGIIQAVPSSSSGTFTGTLTGCATTPTTTINYAQVGNTVVLTGDATGLSATSNSTAKTITGLPTALRPSVAQIVPVVSKDNGGLYVASTATVGTDGVITVNPTPSTTAWTASGTCGIKIMPSEYIIAD